METKRQVLNIIRIQSGRNLLDILESVTTQKDEQLYAQLVEAEQARLESQARTMVRQGTASSVASDGEDKADLFSPTQPLSPVLPSTFAALKKAALENVAKLEARNKVTKNNNYQDLLSAIAKVRPRFTLASR